jgi:hypothetical protein
MKFLNLYWQGLSRKVVGMESDKRLMADIPKKIKNVMGITDKGNLLREGDK